MAEPLYRLVDLEPEWRRYEVKREWVRRVRSEVFAVRPTGPFTDDDFHELEDDVVYHALVGTLAEAHGIRFLCPRCLENGMVRTS